MTTGFVITNPNNELTFSSDGFMYQYIGNASYVSTTTQTTTTGGYSTYTINWAGPILVGLGLVSGGSGYARRIRSMSQSGSTWTITVEAGDGTADSNGFLNQDVVSVLVWGKPLSAASYGMLVYSGSGELAADLSVLPFSIGQTISFAAGSTSQNISVVRIDGIPKLPYVVGDALGTGASNTANGPTGGSVAYSDYRAGWYLDLTANPDQIGRSLIKYNRSVTFEDIHVGSSSTSSYAATNVCTSWYNSALVA